MPVARIVTRHESQALNEASEQLRAAGYHIEVVPPEAIAAAADLVIELDELAANEALGEVLQLARDADVDVYIASGLLAQPATQTHTERSNEPAAEATSSPQLHSDAERGGGVSGTLEELGSARANGRAGIGETISGVRIRIAGAWSQLRQRRAEATQARRLERQHRDIERDERRRQHEVELQRRAEEKQQLLAERERLAAQRERVLREQMARDAAARAERERLEREAMAREAQRRAELARVAEQERQRLAAIEAERLRLVREQQVRQAAAMQAERQREQEARRAAALSAVSEPVAPLSETQPSIPEPVFADAAPVLKPRLIRPARRVPSVRERQWERAAFVASIATLAAMIGYALAGNVRPSSPLPASLMQNGAQQQVPFGPAKIDISSRKSSVPGTSSRTPGAATPGGQLRDKVVPPRVSSKPSPAKPAVPQRARRARRNQSDVVAEDEVIVRHAPTSRAERAQTRDGIRRYSDDN